MTIFDIVSSVLFTKKKNCLISQDQESAFSPYLLNRWASMYSPAVAVRANILNKYLGIFDNKVDLYNLFVAVLPKVTPKKIQYFKKVKKDVDIDSNIELLSKSYEVSKREITNYIAFLKN
jgi:hypothetical protein